MVDKYKDFISKPEINFWTPILFTVITMAVSWFSLSTKVELLTQRVDLLIEQQSQLITKYRDVEIRWGEVANRVTRLETIENIK